MRSILILVLFLMGPLGAWAWFHVGTRPPEVTYEFVVRTNVPGMRFSPVKIGPKEMEILATTNLVNGEFWDGGRKVTVFAAEWSGASARELSVVQHTPDICWVRVGFIPVDLGQPSTRTFALGDVAVPFECRVFEIDGRRELAFWSTLLSGSFQEERMRFRPSAASHSGGAGMGEGALRARMLAGSQFLAAVSGRQPADGTKQFVRFSTPIDTDWESGMERIAARLPEWLSVRSARPNLEPPVPEKGP